MPLRAFHPAVAAWFTGRFGAPTPAQRLAWPAIRAGEHVLVAVPTGSGKTLAAFLAALDDLTREAIASPLPDATRVVYVSPLKALSNDIRKNLQEPLAGIRRELAERGLPDAPIRVMVRTGDTPAAERAAMARKPPHLLVTTPESLYILLTSERGRSLLKTARTLILDEIHAVAGDKRGSHLALSIERLQSLAEAPLVRIGLSATQRPIEEVARFLVGTAAVGPDGAPRCRIADTGHARDLDLRIEIPASPLEAVMSGEVWKETYDRLATLILAHRTTLVFCNTRRMAERVARHLSERLGETLVAAHHGSLSRAQRLSAEERLKTGALRALVATSSLELGIDIGVVDLVCQLGSTRSIAACLQRVGRSGHAVIGLPKGRLFPLSRDELIEGAALLRCVRDGLLDHLSIPRAPLDILAQQLVAEVACREWTEDALFELVRGAWPYRDLPRAAFDAVVRMLADGFTTRRGRRSAHLHHDAVNKRLRGRRGARLTAITGGGAIPDTADYQVVLEPAGTVVGSVHEDFAVESIAGDIFQLGNVSWRILRVEPGKVRVEDARGQPPQIPFWLGEAPSRTDALSRAVSDLREEAARRLEAGGTEAAARWLEGDIGLPAAAAIQAAEHLAAALAALGAMPTRRTLVAERFFDEAGGQQIVLHAPWGGRINRAWGLALRKRFCRQFNFELQAAATEDAIVLSLGPTHSFPLDDLFRFLRSATARDVLVQALLDAPMFPIRWRWNATRSLAVPRFRGGRRVAAPIQRMLAEDLLALVFPDQLACAENLSGARSIPDHPLVEQTIRDCLEEAMDVEGLLAILRDIERGAVRLVARDLGAPSPLAAEILGARPYAYLDDAPLEERRTQAVHARRWLDPATAGDLGRLDAAAIDRVRAEAWPQAENADELHDALMITGFLTQAEGRRGDGGPSWEPLFQELISAGRAALLRPVGPVPGRGAGGGAAAPHPAVASDAGPAPDAVAAPDPVVAPDPVAAPDSVVAPDPVAAPDSVAAPPLLWVAAERLHHLRAALPGSRTEPAIEPPPGSAGEGCTRETGLVEILRGRLEALGPVTAAALGAAAGLTAAETTESLLRLEAEGFVMRGRFTPGTDSEEWCARRLLARIHRATLDRLRREIEPVGTADFVRFLLEWQRAAPADRVRGAGGLQGILEQLEGFEAPAAAWEGEILPARMEHYDPAWLDALCLSGRFAWGRFSRGRRDGAAPPPGADPPADGPPRRHPAPVRTTPIAFLQRSRLAEWGAPRDAEPDAGPVEATLSAAARDLLETLGRRGASFLDDLAAATGLLGGQVEAGLAELVARGLVTSDGFTGLRTLLAPSALRARRAGRRNGLLSGMESAGRWTLLRPAGGAPGAAAAGPPDAGPAPAGGPRDAEPAARVLLRRYGVVFRRLLEREGLMPPWRDLIRVLRRLEARGEVRGGRFVEGVQGEQFALPEAVGLLREVRRRGPAGTLVSLSAADPLCPAGLLAGGARLPAAPANRILYRDGLPIAVREAGEVRLLVDLPPGPAWEARNTLLRRPAVAHLRASLGHSA